MERKSRTILVSLVLIGIIIFRICLDSFLYANI